jgi:hypothetical protein
MLQEDMLAATGEEERWRYIVGVREEDRMLSESERREKGRSSGLGKEKNAGGER